MALTSQFKLGGRRVEVKIVGHETVPALYSPLQVQELHVVPAFSGGGGVVKIIIGVVLIVAAIVLSYFTAGTTSTLIPYGISFLTSAGISLTLGGIIELLTPAPKTSNSNDNGNTGKYLGAPKNTTAIGTRIIQGYGRFQVYGQVLSYNVVANPSPVASSATQTRTTSGFGAI